MKNLTLEPNASKPWGALSRAELKQVMGGVEADMISVPCTYYFWNGTTESGNVTVPRNSGFAFAHQFAEAFCENDPTCQFVDCGY
ncbi:hypothetical protein VRU48_06120 [Pedobacter sp. KR3-3]|uniref:Uncharacterized protein n=1 Tax=Pedobacter albus TaxID=3113905 RepID=A0ABU7I5C8_9SPHI|nr:hypothetical protein [Pedobacter sp. KR3-3]MEE1944675.1 hypothetical protein [Pedobacter sp. KR3-3]